jgi:hypothetical protein
MKLRLNYWQLIALFSPFILVIGCTFMPNHVRAKYYINTELICLLLCIVFLLAISYQTYLVISFNKKIKGSIWIIINNVPPVLLILVCVFGFAILVKDDFTGKNLPDGPTSKSDFWLGKMLVGILFIHELITFFVVNNLYVSAKIEKVKDSLLRQKLSDDFWEPMKKLLIISILSTAGSFVLAIVAVIIKSRFLKD